MRRPAGCGPAARATTRSARPGTRATRASPPPLRLTDPALLHYRSGAFYLVRAGQASPPRERHGRHPARPRRGRGRADRGRQAQGVRAPGAECHPADLDDRLAPAAGHRAGVRDRPGGQARRAHVLARGQHRRLQLRRRVGEPLHRGRRAQRGGYCAFQGLPVPLLFVCEDNGLGISVRTPPGWTEERQRRAGRRSEYFAADGCDLADAYDAAQAAASYVRERRAPAFLHLRTVRLGGHAGTDVESAYRSPAEIAADADARPAAGHRAAAGRVRCDERRRRARPVRGDQGAGADASRRPGRRAPAVGGDRQVMAPIAPRRPSHVAANLAARARQADDWRAAARRFGAPAARGRRAADPGPGDQPHAGRRAGRPAGHDRVRRGRRPQGRRLRRDQRPADARSGPAGSSTRCSTSSPSWASRSAPGLAGLLPVPEIQYLAYLHNAADQIRGEAATLSFFSRAQYRNPMVVRVAGPGLPAGLRRPLPQRQRTRARCATFPAWSSPARPGPTTRRRCCARCLTAAELDGSVCVFLEPIALYHERDLYEPGDGGWLAGYQPPERWAPRTSRSAAAGLCDRAPT